MSNTKVLLDMEGTNATITFYTDEGLNILSPDVLHTFGAAVAQIKTYAKIRCAVVQAKGKVFLAGADVKIMRDYGSEKAREYSVLGQGMFNDLAALPCITVAAINGAALGGGLELALACDFRIAVKSAKLGLPEVSLGLIPGWGGIPRLAKLIGPARSKRLILSGLPVSAEVGHGFGLVDEIVNSAEDLPARVSAFCSSFRRAAPAAVGLAKRAARDMDDLAAFVDCFHTTDSREGMDAFIEKRTASWMA